MSTPPLPAPVIQPSTLVESASGVLGALYLREQMQAYGQHCYEKALLDATNATTPFGKTGAVIAAAIGALK